jgi:hypothetical protein
MGEPRAAPDFIERWSIFPSTDKRRGMTHIAHPDLGRLNFRYEVLLLADDVDEQRLITWLPGDDATARVLARTAAPTSPAQLRVIG